MHEAEVRGVGVSVGDEGRGAPAVVLEADGRLLPIFISPDQAQSMELARRGTPAERPLTHDLLVEMITDFGGAIDQIRVDDLADGTFYAKIDAELYHGGERQRFVFDARPSDGIAIALRVDCPIMVAEDVLDEAGNDPDEFELRESNDDDRGPGPRL
ncbi:MAG: bifunctional nuclease family protein [Halobacteriales archaeon]